MDKFSDIEAFVTVVDTGSFSAAGERLDTAKSAVSRRVSGLEKRLGVKLLNRTTRRLSLTEAGRAFHQRATRILLDLTEAEQSVSDSECELRGRIRLAAPLSFGLSHLAPAIDRFAQAHPEVQFDLDLNDREVNIVEEGFDMAVRIGELQDSSLIARRLCPIRFATVASRDYLERHGVPRTPDDLSHHQGLRYSNKPRQQAWRYTDPQGQEFAPEVPDRLVANNGEILTRAAIDGLGITRQPTFIVYAHLAEGKLIPVLSEFEIKSISMHAVFPPGRYLSRRVRNLADHFSNHFGEHPYWDKDLPSSDLKLV